MDPEGYVDAIDTAELEVHKIIEMTQRLNKQLETLKCDMQSIEENPELNYKEAIINDTPKDEEDSHAMDIDECLQIDTNASLQSLITQYKETEETLDKLFLQIDEKEKHIDEIMFGFHQGSSPPLVKWSTARALPFSRLSPIREADEFDAMPE